MRISSWLRSLKRRTSRRAVVVREGLEHLEPRLLLTSIANVNDGTLAITMFTSEDVRVSAVGVNVRVEFAPHGGTAYTIVDTVTATAASINMIVVNAGGGDSIINLSAV